MLIKVILVIKNSFSSNFPHLSCFFPPNTRFSLLKTLFCPSKLNISHLHGKKIFKLHCQVCKNKRAFLEGNYLLGVKLRYILDEMWLQKVWLVAVCCFGERKWFFCSKLSLKLC